MSDLEDLINLMMERPNDPLFIDSETCGLHGMPVLYQVGVGQSKEYLIDLWLEPASVTMILMELIANHKGGCVFFNGAFDWFMTCKWYTVIGYWLGKYPERELEEPVNHIEEIAYCEEHGRFGKCLKPVKTIDLFLVAKKTHYQSLMDRNDIRIKRVPTAIADHLARRLTKDVPLKDVYFARRKDPTTRWTVQDLHDDMGELIPTFKDLKLSFCPSSGLKALAADALDFTDTVSFTEIEPPETSKPVEDGFAPFCTAPIKDKDTKRFLTPCPENNWLGKWPAFGKIRTHIDHWAYSRPAREYARKDIVYTRGLYYYFAALFAGCSHEQAQQYALGDSPRIYNLEFNDDDSVIACMVAAVRWAGFSIKKDEFIAARNEARAKQDGSKLNFNSVEVCKKYLTEVMDPFLIASVKKGTGKFSTGGIILEDLAKLKEAETCPECYGIDDDCEVCHGTGQVYTGGRHPVADRAQEILDFRHAGKRADMLDKLIIAGRFHASFKVIGTLSGRMAGGDGLNAQGIESSKKMRAMFDLADNGLVLSIGDYSAFEVMIMNAIYEDPQLIEDSTAYRDCPFCGGVGCNHEDCHDGKAKIKLYGVGGALFFNKTYEEIMKTKGLEGDQDLYGRSKSGVLALFYQGEAYTLGTRIGVGEEEGQAGYDRWRDRYTKMYAEIDKTNALYRALSQDQATRMIDWQDPLEYAETLFGFKRWFTLEIKIMKALYDIGSNPPKEWASIKESVLRSDRPQSAMGAARSACFGAAFKIQGSMQRAAGNHRIQGTGAAVTKGLQCRLWELQPSGAHDWVIKPMNIHDEVPCVHKPELREEVKRRVDEYNKEMRAQVPLLAMDWDSHAVSWADK